MKTQVLKQAEASFLKRYPGGFAHPEMVAIGKKHRMEQLVDLAKQSFTKARFDNPIEIVDSMARLVSRSSMVSMFEKPKFKAMAAELSMVDRRRLADALFALLHGKQEGGFEELVEQLKTHKLARWTLTTVFGAYYRPNKDVFVKPTTAKLIISALGIDLRYQATPTWAFYREFRKQIQQLKAQVSPDLAPSNAAFCGFLMVSLADTSQA